MTDPSGAKPSVPNAVPISNLLSLAAVKIFPSRKKSDGEILKGGHATGFFWQKKEILYLITNWHNVCAWDPIQDHALSKMAFTPNCVNFALELRQDLEDGRIKRDRRQATIDLFDDAGSPHWLEHPEFGRQVDVIALKVGEIGEAILLNRPLNTYEDFTDFSVIVGDDAFVLGFPHGLDGGPGLPIWKRASIATEPHYNLGGLPKLLIDTATRQGMSGGPVIAVRRGLTAPRGAKSFGESFIGLSETFLGVYSGRIGDDPLGVQLGIVWKASVIDEVISGGTLGKSPF